LAERESRGNLRFGVVNAGLSGNRVLHDQPNAIFGPDALARFDRDVLAVPGVTHVTLMEGINDIGQANQLGIQQVTADEIIDGYKQIVARAHERGLKIFGATLTPFAVTTIANYFSEAGEAKRQAVNRFIRTSGLFDGVIDFDRAIRDPADPIRMLPAFDSGDHLHPNDAGYRAMAQAVDLRLFER
jgi:lysophospholipase L1-like esterase